MKKSLKWNYFCLLVPYKNYTVFQLENNVLYFDTSALLASKTNEEQLVLKWRKELVLATNWLNNKKKCKKLCRPDILYW